MSCCSRGAGIPIDVALGATPFEERAADRASAFTIEEDVLLELKEEPEAAGRLRAILAASKD